MNTFKYSRNLDVNLLPRPIIPNHEEWIKMHDRSWELAYKHIRFHDGENKFWYMDEAHTEGQVWQWDTCFMALYSHYAPELFPGMASLDNFYYWQRENGYISMTHYLESGEEVYGERINPQLFAWVEERWYELTGDSSRIERVLPILIRYFDWCKANRSRGKVVTPNSGDTNKGLDGEGAGLLWFTCCGAGGCDNSPRSMHLGWNGGELAWVDATAFQALSAKCIAKLARAIENNEISKRFDKEFEHLKKLSNQYLWCEKSQFYHDIFMDGNYLSTKTAVSFYSLLAGIPDQSKAEGLLGHIRNPHEFWRPHPIPTLSADDPNYEEKGAYWLGGVWAPTNYMIIKGLENYGYNSTAHKIAVKHLNAIAATHKSIEPHTIWEAYAPEYIDQPATIKNRIDLCKPDFCGWSALGGINMLYENILGIRKNEATGTITWCPILKEDHGIENYPFLNERISLYASEVIKGTRQIEINSKKSFDLIVIHEDGTKKIFKINPGKQIILN